MYIVYSGHVLLTYMIIFLGIFWLAKAIKTGEENKELQMRIDFFAKGYPFLFMYFFKFNQTNFDLF